jgi:PBP1b-binding outer membrane lipoprotein LpoB
MVKAIFLVAFSLLFLSGCEDSEAAKKEARIKAAQEQTCKEFPRTATGCK